MSIDQNNNTAGPQKNIKLTYLLTTTKANRLRWGRDVQKVKQKTCQEKLKAKTRKVHNHTMYHTAAYYASDTK